MLIVGAGFSGATLARLLAEAGHKCLVLDSRNHIAGNCHTERDAQTGILVHRYGPHIFHTDDDAIWNFVQRFGDFEPYRHRVMSVTQGRLFQLPINLDTINAFFHTELNPAEAEAFIRSRTVAIADPQNFEEQALATIGRELYEAFFLGYTLKQWGIHPRDLPASLLKRLPLRFTDDSNYFHHTRQAMPRQGYSQIVGAMLQHDNIEVRLGCEAATLGQQERFLHTFYSGKIDQYFDYRFGRLSYRTLDFEVQRASTPAQNVPVMNYPDMTVPWTRVTEHKLLAPWEAERQVGSIAFREYSRDCGENDIPYYPVHLATEQTMLRTYVERAEAQSGTTFLGRLGCFAYLDMDAAIGRAMQLGQAAIAAFSGGPPLKAFLHRPIAAT